MEQQYLTDSDFKHFLGERTRERIAELLHEIQVFEYVLRDRGLWGWEKARYKSLGGILKINEDILNSIDPEFNSIQ